MDHNNSLLDGMQLFCTIVQENGLTAAARRLGHTPSHVSKELARLENRLGTRLLNRTTRKISLTETGKIYFENANSIVSQAQAIEDRLQKIGDHPFGELKIGVPVIFAHCGFNRWLGEFLDQYPDITLNVEVSERKADLISEGFDLLVRIGAMPMSDLITRTLFTTSMLTVASPDYLTRTGTPTHPSQLTDKNVIDFSFRSIASTWTYFDKSGQQISVSVNPKARCNDAFTEKELALSGAGITRLPMMVCKEELKDEKLVRILEDFEPRDSDVQIVYPSRQHLPPKTRAMIDFLISKCSQLGTAA